MKNDDKVRLICLPFAGGSRYSYRALVEELPDFIESLVIELPGRGRRVRQPLLTNVDAMVADILRCLAELQRCSYALFGHSMGALLAHLVVSKLVRASEPLPRHLFLSGMEAPSVPPKKLVGTLPDAEFLEHLEDLGALPPELKQDHELLEMFLPILRADILAVESYEHRPSKPHEVRTTVVYGADDHMTREDVTSWQAITTVPLDVR